MTTPFIVIEDGIPRVADELPPVRVYRYCLIRRSWEDSHAFNQDSEYRISVVDPPPIGPFAKFLAYTIYNPVVPDVGEWTVCGKYDPNAVLTFVEAGLEHDDDIIQQWFDADEVMKLLRAGDSYSNMVLAVRTICGEHETHDDVRRFMESVLGKQR